jgi:DNA-binding winged helix-turn-helix (wHTH) protein
VRSTGRLAFGDYCLDLGSERVLRGAAPVALTPKAFAVLAHLAARPEQLVTKEELLDAVWPDTHVGDAVLKVVVHELRQALDDDARAPRYIATVHRRGYRFVATVATVAPVDAEPAGRPPAAAAPVAAAGPGLIGRDEELGRLRRAYQRACAGERQLVFVSGEGGIGKTALIDAFATTVLDAGTLRARGQCLEHHGSGEAYLPILEALAAICRADPQGEFVETLRRQAPTWLAQLPGGGGATAGAATSRERMQRELADALDVLTAAVPLVVMLEDMHWSDASSVDLLSRVAHRREPARLLVVVTYRPVEVILARHPLKPIKQRLEQQRLCEEIRLAHFGTAEVERYLAARFGGQPTPSLAAAVFERTAGNPLFVVTLVDDLAARRWLVADGATPCLAVPVERVREAVPEGLREMIEVQLERLPADHVAYLEAASVVGEEFPSAALADALGLPRAAAEAACEAEQRQSGHLLPDGVATLADGSICGRYRFAHALHRDVVFQRIGRPRRLALHRAVGEWLETQGASPAELARHFVEAADAGTPRKAVTYLCRAAARAVELSAHAEAVRHYRTALALLAAHPTCAERGEAGRLHIALGESLERDGAIGLAAEAFRAAAQAARDIDDPELFARAALGLGRGHHQVDVVDAALIALLEEALARLGPQPSALRACLLARLDTALSPMPGAHERRAALAREALAYARRQGDPDTVLLVVRYTRWAFNGRESPAELRRAAADMARLAAAASEPERAMEFLLVRLTQLHELGDAATAATELEDFARRAEAAGVPWFQWFAHRLLAYRALEEGRFAAAERAMQAALTVGQRTDHPNVRPTHGAQFIELHLQRGLWREIEPPLAAIVERRPEQLTTRAAWAYVRARLGDAAGARRVFEALAADDFAAIPRDSLWLMVLARLIEVCVALGDARRAETLQTLFAPYADRVIGAGAAFASMGHGSRYLALLAHARRDWEAGAAHFERALAIHERMGARPWLARTLAEHGRLLHARPLTGAARAAGRRRAAGQLRRARALAAALGMHGVAE